MTTINNEEICSICISEEEKSDYKTICKHNFHKNCLEKWLKVSSKRNNYSCPNCRQVIISYEKIQQIEIREFIVSVFLVLFLLVLVFSITIILIEFILLGQ